MDVLDSLLPQSASALTGEHTAAMHGESGAVADPAAGASLHSTGQRMVMEN